jgi:hypothetical protein
LPTDVEGPPSPSLLLPANLLFFPAKLDGAVKLGKAAAHMRRAIPGVRPFSTLAAQGEATQGKERNELRKGPREHGCASGVKADQRSGRLIVVVSMSRHREVVQRLPSLSSPSRIPSRSHSVAIAAGTGAYAVTLKRRAARQRLTERGIDDAEERSYGAHRGHRFRLPLKANVSDRSGWPFIDEGSSLVLFLRRHRASTVCAVVALRRVGDEVLGGVVLPLDAAVAVQIVAEAVALMK